MNIKIPFFDISIKLSSKKDKPQYPGHFAKIKLSEYAKSQGINDDWNKILVRYLDGKPVEIVPYTEEEAQIWREVYEIPVEEEVFKEEDFEFDTVGITGSVLGNT